MPLPKFNYVAATSLEHACALLEQHGADARVMAGGTDVVLRMRTHGVAPPVVVGLRGAAGLVALRLDLESGLHIGPMVRCADVANHDGIHRHYPALAAAGMQMGTVQVRNMGTVVGNVCNASPAADTAPPLLAYGARVRTVRTGGHERWLPLEELFCSPGRTALKHGELVAEIHVPPPEPGARACFLRLSQRSKVDISQALVCAHVALDGARCRSARLALGAVAPVPMRARAAEACLEGAVLDAQTIARAAAAAAEDCRPISDVRASAAYRRRMIQVLCTRALTACLAAPA